MGTTLKIAVGVAVGVVLAVIALFVLLSLYFGSSGDGSTNLQGETREEYCQRLYGPESGYPEKGYDKTGAMADDRVQMMAACMGY
jgi:hypothetical protein